jgi:oligopeptide/dipeptide ABC transporter ATP-binding protein
MRQRVVIAAALANDPSVLVADEPTTALDVTIQTQILELIRRLQRELEMAILLITHDLAVVSETCDRVGVMYAGQLIEVGPSQQVLEHPRHPYTSGLLGAIPAADIRPGELAAIPGEVPNLEDPPPGCRFAARCASRMEVCSAVPPRTDQSGIDVACWLYAKDEAPTALAQAPLEVDP